MYFLPKTKSGVIIRSIIGTIFCILVAVMLDIVSSTVIGDVKNRISIVSDVLIPIFLAGPLFYITMSKILELALAREELQRLASTDSLTAVLNRGAFTMLVEAYLERAQNGSGSQNGALLVVDADFFKNINDTYGHQIGDRALIGIADAMRSCIREMDIVGRIGGEEFGVFLPGAEAGTAALIAERIRQIVGKTPIVDAQTRGFLSVSIGAAVFFSAVSYQELFLVADQKLYEAKKIGRNRVELGIIPHRRQNPGASRPCGGVVGADERRSSS
jgi:diguanylate cyclase